MMVPIDDHIVHRGDGVFEAIRVSHRRPYLLEEHLHRLQLSASAIGLTLPLNENDLKEVILQTLQVAFHSRVSETEALLRLYISRGPGGFTTNPYECVGAQVYLVVTAFKPFSQLCYEQGVTVHWSQIAVKAGAFAQIKSCNYLPNVLMKKEALDQGVDFTISLDEHGFLAESSTENCAIISQSGEFLVPSFERTLRGVTVLRAMELAQVALEQGLITQIRQAKISVTEAHAAREFLLFGTTMDCLPVVKVAGRPVGSGSPGPMARFFLQALEKDRLHGF